MAELSLLTSGLMGAGTLLDFTSRLANMRGASAAAGANATLQRRNAARALQDAANTRLSAFRRSEDIKAIGRQRIGRLTAVAAARGVQAESGSALEQLAAEAYQSGREASEELYSGLLEEHRAKVEALSRKWQADVIKAQAKHAKRQAILGAIGGLAQNVAVGLPTYMQGFGAARSLLSQRPAPQSLSFQMPPGE